MDMGIPSYFSMTVGRDLGSPLGGWVNEPEKALQFARTKDAQAFLDKMLSFAAPFSEVAEV
jgi:hypothetical protein